MADIRITRRQALVAAVAAIVVAEASPQLASADNRVVTYALDPTRNGTCTGGCASCHACLTHAANKLFSTTAAAGIGRAHPGCLCAVVPGQQLATATHTNLFMTAAVADRRNAAAAAILAAELEKHSVPMVSGALPVLALIGGSVGLAVVAARRRLDLT